MNTEYAGFWPRAFATIIDWIWLYGFVYAWLWFSAGPDIFKPDAGYTATRIIVEWIIPLIVVVTFWVTKAATPGKMLFKMRIVDAESLQSVSPARLLVRYLSYAVSAAPFGLGLLWVAFDKKKQGWHDKIARTVIVRGD